MPSHDVQVVHPANFTKYCACGTQIDPERLSLLPNTRTCTTCSREKPRFDPNEVCDRASPSGQNGFSPKS
mgnify:CR=1 FL=1